MPLRSYHARNSPPSRLDHTLAHPFEVGLAIFATANGIAGLFLLITNGISFTPSVDSLPQWTASILCIALMAGGVFTLLGIYDEHDDLMVGYARERLGLFLSCSAWTVYAIVSGFAFPLFLGWRFGLIIAACCGLRLWATYREEHRLRNPDAVENISPLITGVIGSAQEAASKAQADASAAQAAASAAQDIASEAMHVQNGTTEDDGKSDEVEG